jgi:ABC-type Fe3+/spermidine/putrescine transport system ATPase subunit
VLQVDTPAGLYENPKSRAVAGFIGNMNFFAGTVVGSTAAMTEIDVQGIGRQRVDASVSRHHVGARVLMAIRPEKLALSLDAPVGSHGSVAGILQATAYLGDRRQFYTKINGKAEPVIASVQNHHHALPQDIEQGKDVWLTWRNDAFVVLDHE